MTSPFTGGEVILCKDLKEFEFRGFKFTIIQHQYKCVDTGELFTDTSLDQLNLNQVYNQYRVKEGIPFRDDIIAYRKQYDLPATKMSKLLGFGVNMYGKYEAGEIPNSSNAKLITICKDPKIFKNYIYLSKSQEFSDKEREQILKKIDKAIERKHDEVHYKFEEYAALGNIERGILTGYVLPNLAKAREMVIYFAGVCSPFITKMNKLLFYADFLNYKRTGFSISGMTYQAIPKGPVPLRYDGLYGNVSDITERKEEFFTDEISGERIINIKEFDASLFSLEESETLKLVANRFKSTATKEIVNISHAETAWIENEKNKNCISYQLAFDLKAL